MMEAAARAAFSASALSLGANSLKIALVVERSRDARAQAMKVPARLRMNVIGKPGVDKADFELWCLAVSAINGCGVCIDSHEKILREAGLTAEQIQAAVRIAATVHGVAATLDGEAHSADLVANTVAA